MSDPGDCFVCRKRRDWPAALWIHEDDLGQVSHAGGESIYHGYLFVEPRRHAPGWEDLSGAEAAHLGELLRRSARALRNVGCDHVYAFVYGDGVPHLHVHLVGRWPGAPEEYRTVATADWPDAPRSDRTEIAGFVDRLRDAFLTS
ncbi:MAG: HIT family protein [Microlunatus sp.]|nr:HIT family protein [Microlunatus sp.]